MAYHEVVYDCPAYKVYRQNAAFHAAHPGAVLLLHDMSLGLKRVHRDGQVYYLEFLVGTVAGMAVARGADVRQALNQAEERGHAIHWINACGCSITSQKRPQKALVLVEVGMLVQIEGVAYRVKAERNDNLGLEPVASIAQAINEKAAYAAEEYWEYQRGNVSAEQAAVAIGKLGFVVDPVVLQDARARDIKPVVHLYGVKHELEKV